MAESVVDAPKVNEVGRRDPSPPALEVSVSFGRYENDALSWEKWSTFTPNKYLEEVEKCATPGSVAQKKAYFEAHYKKISEKKVELVVDQDKQVESKLLKPDDQDCQDFETVAPVLACSLAAAVVDSSRSSLNGPTDSGIGQNEMDFVNAVDETHKIQPNVDIVSSTEDRFLLEDAIKKEVVKEIDAPNLGKPEVVLSLKENVSIDVVMDTPRDDSKKHGDKLKQALPLKGTRKHGEKWESKETKNTARKDKERIARIDRPKGTTKVNQPASRTSQKQDAPLGKCRNATTIKKKPASPAPKVAGGLSTPKVTKTSSNQMTMSQSSIKERVSTLSRSRDSSGPVCKQVAPKSLHMSLGLGPSNSDPSSHSTNRKPLIMEKMGDKDIVKRAFKTFQSRLRLPSEEQAAASKQNLGPVSRDISSASGRDDRGRPFKASGAVKRMTKGDPSPGAKGHENPQGMRTILKRREGISNTSEGSQSLRARPKDAKGTDFKRLTQSLNYKAMPMSGLHRGPKVSRGSLVKEGSINESRN